MNCIGGEWALLFGVDSLGFFNCLHIDGERSCVSG